MGSSELEVINEINEVINDCSEKPYFVVSE